MTIAVLALAGCGGAGHPDEGAKRAVLAANQALDKALVDGDAAALERLYTDDYAVIDDDGGLHRKREQVSYMTTEVDVLNAANHDIDVAMLGDDAALVTGQLTGRYRLGGQEADFTERYTSVWVRDGGAWRVKHEHSSSLPPAPAGTAP